MSDFSISLPELVVLALACVAYAVFLWMNFRAGRYVMLWSSIGIITIQFGSALGTTNILAALAAVGFHGALVAAIYTATRKNALVLARQSVSPRD